MPTIAAFVAQRLRHYAGSRIEELDEAGFLELAGGGEGQRSGGDEAKFPRHLVGGEMRGAMAVRVSAVGAVPSRGTMTAATRWSRSGSGRPIT